MRCVRRLSLFVLLLIVAVLPSMAAPVVVDGPAPRGRGELEWAALRRYSTADGLPQNTVHALAQDSAGYVYAGTEDGLAQFDGRQWRRIALPERAGVRPYVMHLVASGDGSLWIGSDSVGLWRRDGSGRVHSVPGLPAELALEALLLRNESSVFAGTPRGVYRCDAAGCTLLQATQKLEVAALLQGQGPNGAALWIGTNEAGLFRLDDPDGAAPQLADWHLGKRDGLPNDAVRSLVLWGGADGRDLWIGTGRGLARLAQGRLVVYDATTGFPEGTAAPLLPGVDRDGRPLLRVGLARAGLAELGEDGSVQLVTRAEGLPEDGVRSLLETGESATHRILWLGTTSSGVVRREPGRWAALDERHGLPHRVVFGIGRAVFPDGVDSPWIGTVEGPARWMGGSWQRFLPPPYERSTVFALVRDGATVWLATDQGVIGLEKGSVRQYSADNSDLPGLTVLDVIAQDAFDGHHLWIATRHGLARLSKGVIQREHLPLADGAPMVRKLLLAPATDGRERLWAATASGLLWRDEAGWHAVPDGCLPSPELLDMQLQRSADGRQALWVASRAGVVRVDLGGPLRCVGLPAAARPAGQVYQQAVDQAGRLYVFGSDGVTRYTFADPLADSLLLQQVTHFGMEDGLPGLEFNRASYVDARGRVWAGSVDGLALYDPAQEATAGPAAPLRLREASTERGTLLEPGTRLAAGDNSVRAEVSLLAYERPQQIRYRAELVGLRGDSPAWVVDPQFQFSRLPPGAYRLRLRAQDAYGVEAAPIEIAFQLKAPWWQTVPALIGFGIALLLAGLLAGRWRNRHLARRAGQLQREVALRTRELADANRRLEHASLTDPLTGLWNRRHFSLEMPAECARALRRAEEGDTRTVLGLVLIDCDHFKQINDRHGHAVGDAVLVEIAARLRSQAREGDVLLRWGGEEFLLVLRDTDRDSLAAAARRVLDGIGGRPFVFGVEPLAVTCSLGVCAFPFDSAAPGVLSLDACLRIADAALYRAKHQGRDRAVLAQSRGHEHEPAWLDVPRGAP
ncbi:diguanylate cyclase (GGDEF)-like protein [Tahibacter aquaticus]|uniref:diguanylate cyclase n=1 Tax=Tahibacter aquaticus TaxID=520092 RepID=A0A4R6YSR0_9GAMM|nr:diguanylate cyclase (GGDEF)-like protein [Tahibacter aquaticus]